MRKPKTSKFIIYFFLLSFSQFSFATAKTPSTEKTSSYFSAPGTAGALVGTVTGFGIGHGIQGRYSDNGWLFTTSQVVGLGLIISGGFFASCGRNADGSIKECGDETKRNLGVLIFVGSRFYEIYDLWTNTQNNWTISPTNDGLQAQWQINF